MADTDENGDQSYFPSAKARFVVRFEEFGTRVLAAKKPAKTVTLLKGVKDDRAPLQVTPDPTAPDGLRRFLLTSGSGPPKTGGAGTDQIKSADNLTHAIEGVVPKKASWRQNGIRTADTLSLTIRFQDMPIDPRTIRACAVEFYLGTVSSTEFAAGISGRTRAATNGTEQLNLVADTYLDTQGRSRTNLRFQGWVDKYKVVAGDGEALLELECCDNTRLLEKQIRPPKLVIGMEKPIDEAIAEYLSHFPQMAGLTVEYLPTSVAAADIPKLKGVLSHSSFVPNLGPPAGGGGATGGASETTLDYLTSIVGQIAHSIRVDGTRLVIQRASNLLGTGPVPRPGDPYQGRNLPSGRYPVRALIYGRNVLEYSVERNFARAQPKNVEVRSYDPERKSVVVARFPDKGDEISNAGPGDGKTDNDFTVYPVSDGIRDKVLLKSIAEEVYSVMGRQELIVTVKTKNLASFGGDNEDPDLLDMTIGDAFELLSDGGNPTAQGTMTELEQNLRSSSLNEQLLLKYGFEAEFAKAYAKAFTSAGFQKEYKLKEMGVEWDVDEGVSFDLTGANYVVARVDRPTAQSTVQSPAKKPAAPTPKGQPPKGTPGGSGGAVVAATPQAPTPTVPAGFEAVGQNPDGSLVLRKIS